MAIAIDLRDLRQADLDACRGNGCFYVSPCIIGTLIPEDKRLALDNADLDETDVRSLVKAGYLELPADQLADAIAMQQAFDGRPCQGVPQDFSEVTRIASKWMVEKAA